MNKKDYYDKLYNNKDNNSTAKNNIQNTCEVDDCFVNEKGLLKLKDNIEYKEALNKIHDHLFSLRLNEDE